MKNENIQPAIDFEKLRHEFNLSCTKREAVYRGLLPGISASTLSRFKEGKPLTSEHFIEVCNWIGMPPEAFFVANKGAVVHYPNDGVIAKLKAVLYSDQTLSQQSRDVLLDLMEAAYRQYAEGQ